MTVPATKTTGGQSVGAGGPPNPVEGTPVPTTTGGPVSRPSHVLRMKADGGEGFTTICGLRQFQNDDGTVTYKVARGETPSLTYAIFTNTDKSREGDPDFVLKAKDAGTGKFSVRITGLWQNQSKAGNSYLHGSQKEGDHAGNYYVFEQTQQG